MHSPNVRLFASLAAASILCFAILALRIERTGEHFYGFLVWNLVLAWVPLVLSATAYARVGSRLDAPGSALLVLWLLFFPNAPYLLTDFIHLGADGFRAPLWYDALMLSSFAWTGLMLGFVSVYVVQTIVARLFGAAASWVVVVGAFLLASFGVYLGRFVRFNSWDALVRPGRVLHVVQRQLQNPLHHPRLVGILIVLTAGLLVSYGVVYAVAVAYSALRPCGERNNSFEP